MQREGGISRREFIPGALAAVAAGRWSWAQVAASVPAAAGTPRVIATVERTRP